MCTYDIITLMESVLLNGVMFCIALMRKVSALRYSSLLGLFSVTFMVIVVSVLYFKNFCSGNSGIECLKDDWNAAPKFNDNISDAC